MKEASGKTETLNGVQLYFEVHGSGDPLVLLHGFSGSSQDWKPSLQESVISSRVVGRDGEGDTAIELVGDTQQRSWSGHWPTMAGILEDCDWVSPRLNSWVGRLRDSAITSEPMPKQSRSLARMSAAQQRLGKKIRALREKQGLSQEALADLCELNRVHIGIIEQGKINLTLTTLDKVARNLKTTCATLLRGIL